MAIAGKFSPMYNCPSAEISLERYSKGSKYKTLVTAKLGQCARTVLDAAPGPQEVQKQYDIPSARRDRRVAAELAAVAAITTCNGCPYKGMSMTDAKIRKLSDVRRLDEAKLEDSRVRRETVENELFIKRAHDEINTNNPPQEL